MAYDGFDNINQLHLQAAIEAEIDLLKQLNILNKELKLLRTQPANTNTSVPLENVTNLLGIVANVLPSTSTTRESFYALVLRVITRTLTRNYV